MHHLEAVARNRLRRSHPLTKRIRRAAGGGGDLVAQLDGLLRNPVNGDELAQIVKDFAIFTVPPPGFKFLHEQLLDALVKDARAESEKRAARAQLRSLWGVTPINNMMPCCRADRLLGNEAESLVFTTYYITADFSIVLKQHQDWILANRPELLSAFRWLVFSWAILSYDVFHYFNDAGILADIGGYNGTDQFGISLTEMRLLKAAGKRLFTYAYGADHRSRAKTLASNPYNFCTFCTEIGKHCLCDDSKAERMLTVIGQYANAMVASGLSCEQIPNSVDLHYLVVDTEALKARPSARPHGPLRIAHVPNHPFFKGTHFLEAAVEQLQAEGEAVELRMLSGVPQDEVFEHMTSCDVVADQFISGWYGLTSLEAMALGRPVLCYLREDLSPVSKTEFPIINAHPERLKDVLRDLIARRSELPEIGRQSRLYVERHHSVSAFSKRLQELYLDHAAFDEPLRTRIRTGEAPAPQGAELSRASFAERLRAAWREASQPADGIVATIRRFGVRLLQAVRFRLANRASTLKSGWSPVRRFLRTTSDAVFDSFGFSAMRLIVALSRKSTMRRMRAGKLRSLWGVTPILTLPLLARCDQMLGLESKSLVFTTYYITEVFDINLKRQQDFLLKYLPFLYRPFLHFVLARNLMRYDVFHLFYDRGMLAPAGKLGINPHELAVLKNAGKALYTYAYGADVRTRETTLALGRYNLCAECPEPTRHCICDDASGQNNIQHINRHATAMLAMGDMTAYVPGCRDLHYWPVDTDKIAYIGVRPDWGRPLRVAHAPNHTFFKGTTYLEKAIAKLQAEGRAIELIRVQGVSNAEVLEFLSGADIVADQFIAGFHGYTTLEAMALGKPVLCYLRDDSMAIDSRHCPIIRSDPDSLYDVLTACLDGAHDLVEIGRRSRNYVEHYYSLPAVAARLGQLYLDTLDLSEPACNTLRERIEACRSLVPPLATIDSTVSSDA